jgi:hypothetical protein
MTVQMSTDIRNAMLDAIESITGTSPILKVRTGVPPANCAAADSGAVLSTVNLPADWMLAAALGQKVKSGTWQDLTADADGDAGHFRIYASDGVTCKFQGTYGTTGTDMIGDSTEFNIGQTFTVLTFTLIAGNA